MAARYTAPPSGAGQPLPPSVGLSFSLPSQRRLKLGEQRQQPGIRKQPPVSHREGTQRSTPEPPAHGEYSQAFHPIIMRRIRLQTDRPGRLPAGVLLADLRRPPIRPELSSPLNVRPPLAEPIVATDHQPEDIIGTKKTNRENPFAPEPELLRHVRLNPPRFKVCSKESTSWLRFPGKSYTKQRSLVHTITTLGKLKKLEGDFSFHELFPDTAEGRRFANAIKIAAEKNVRFKLQRRTDGKRVFVFNPDLPAITPDVRRISDKHWDNLKEQLHRYCIQPSDDS